MTLQVVGKGPFKGSMAQRVLGTLMGDTSPIITVIPNIEYPTLYYMSDCQNYGPFLGP